MDRRWLTLLLSPLSLVLISAGRLLIIANYNSTTAVTIASSGGYVNTLLGSVIPLVPVFIPYIALALLLFRQFFLSAVAFAFTVFIAPTTMKLPATRQLAITDMDHLTRVAGSYWFITSLIVIVIFMIAYKSHGSMLEALATVLALALAFSVFFAPPIEDVSLPSSLHPASGILDRLFGLASNYPARATVIGIVILLLLLGGAFRRNPGPDGHESPLMITAIALLVAAVMLPYIYTIYPIPSHSDYYVGVLRSPWLPAEKFVLKNGHNYYGYALASDEHWFTVLLSKDRKIVYIPADDLARQSVCETESERKLPVEPPLITTFYTKPPLIRACADRKYLRKPHPHPRHRPGPPRQRHPTPPERRPPGRTGDD